MKKTNKLYQRVLALVLAVMLCVGMMPMAVLAEGKESTCGMEEHTHVKTCWKGTTAICGKVKHTHTDECYKDTEIETEDDSKGGDGDGQTGGDQTGTGDSQAGGDQTGIGDSQTGGDQTGIGDSQTGGDQTGIGDSQTGGDQTGTGDSQTGGTGDGAGDQEPSDDKEPENPDSDHSTRGPDLICGKEEHTHVDGCCGGLFCGLEEHTHKDFCYGTIECTKKGNCPASQHYVDCPKVCCDRTIFCEGPNHFTGCKSVCTGYDNCPALEHNHDCKVLKAALAKTSELIVGGSVTVKVGNDGGEWRYDSSKVTIKNVWSNAYTITAEGVTGDDPIICTYYKRVNGDQYELGFFAVKVSPHQISAETSTTLTYTGAEQPLDSKDVTVTVDGKETTNFEITGYKDKDGNSINGEPKDTGTYTVIIKVTGEDGAEIGTTTVEYTIAPATLTATYNGETVTVGGTPGGVVTVVGFVDGESADGAEGYVAPIVDLTGIDTSSAGTHHLTPAGGAARNYVFNYVGGDLTVNPIPTPAPATPTPVPITPTPPTSSPSNEPSTEPSIEPSDDPTDIPDPTPPLTESPDVTPTPSTPPVTPDPEPSEPPVEIPDDDPPLAEIPDEDPPLAEIPDDTTEIEDEVVPLADVPKTGDDAKIWLTLALLSAAGLGVIGLMQRRTRKNGKDS